MVQRMLVPMHEPIAKAVAVTAGAGIAGYAAYAATTFLRYGKPRIGHQADPLLDRFMPRYDVVERHETRVDAPPAATFSAAKEMDFDSSRLVRAIFKGRELIFGPNRTPHLRRRACSRPRYRSGGGYSRRLPITRSSSGR